MLNLQILYSMTICAPTKFTDPKVSWHVFLAGPIMGAEHWQHNMPNLENVIWFSPRRESYKNFNYDEQVDWEEINMRFADAIIFWIPEPTNFEELARHNHDYAQTTRTEFGEYLARGKKVIFGCYEGFGGKRYFERKLEQYHMGEIHNSIEECVEALKEYIDGCVKHPKVYFTSDTHFGSSRTLTLSNRPFINVHDMDMNLIENWNNTVHPCDKIYHLGDFGETQYANYLNGTLYLLDGNYERDGKSKRPTTPYVQIETDDGCHQVFYGKTYILSHEPTVGKNYMLGHGVANAFVLFGHIHGRQKCKAFGMDVGVDANNYKPVELGDVEFYRIAIESGYYDYDVWVN